MTVLMTSARAHLAILAIKGIGDTSARKLVDRFESLEEIRTAPDEAFKGVVNQTIREALRNDALMQRALERADEAQATADRLGAVILTRFDEAYPRRLKGFEENPLLLHAIGDLSSLEHSVAVVGTREPSHYGEVVTNRLAGLLADEGFGIVSGLAYGVDSIAHRAALQHGAPTVAFLGCGLDALTSRTKQSLADAILSGGGAIVSEQPFGKPEDAGTLIRRNRLQSGSSAATFITQCGVASGTMHTMRYAVQQGRPIYVPMPPDGYAEEPQNEGVLMLAGTPGSQLAERVDVKASIVEILETRFADRPVVNVLRGRDDYPRMLAEIRSLIEADAAPVMAAAI